MKNSMPQGGCLILSPINLWENDPLKLLNDSSVTETLRKNFCFSPNLCLNQIFGGGKHFSIKNPHEFQFFITLILKQFDSKFIENLRQNLKAAPEKDSRL